MVQYVSSGSHAMPQRRQPERTYKMAICKDKAVLERFRQLPMACEMAHADLVWLRALVDAVLNAPTTEGGKIPARFLPSYVDDVEEYANSESFPSAGESGKIYVDEATGNTYRWSGSAYIQISFAELAEAYVDAEHPGRIGLMSARDKAALAGKAEKSEMAVTPGEGADADKTTIQLKQGTSAVVLVGHQDVSGKAEKSEMSVASVTGSPGKKRVTLKTGTSVDVLVDDSGKADKVANPANGNFAGLDANGNLVDSGKKESDFVPASFAPAQASASNQLADKDFVNSSVATNTATFRGTYNLVVDLSLAVDATAQQVVAALAAKLAALGVTPDNNDYVFVQVPADEDPVVPDHVERVDRYKYSGETGAWGLEFTLNNSSFTAAQWAAINSGITGDAVTKLVGIAAGAQVNVIESVKVNGVAVAPEGKSVNIAPLAGQTMPSVPTQAELTAAVKSIFTALGGTVQ